MHQVDLCELREDSLNILTPHVPLLLLYIRIFEGWTWCTFGPTDLSEVGRGLHFTCNGTQHSFSLRATSELTNVSKRPTATFQDLN